MNRARTISIVLTLAACTGLWFLRGEISQFRGGLLWDLRFVALGVATALVLTLAEALSTRMGGGR